MRRGGCLSAGAANTCCQLALATTPPLISMSALASAAVVVMSMATLAPCTS